MILFISDMDGTLLNDSSQISSYTACVINRLVSEGSGFTVATARTPLSAFPLLQGLHVSHPLILMNGALLYSVNEQKILYSSGFPEHSIRALAEAERLCGMEGAFFSLEKDRLRINMGNVRDCLITYYADPLRLSGDPLILPEFCRRNAGELLNETLLYGLYMDNEPGRLLQMKELLSSDGGLCLDYYKDKYTQNRWCLEISNASTTKGTAVALLRELYMPEKVIAFGDGWNDHSLFSACDESYAMGNADPKLKEIADAVIGKNTDDGVAIAMANYWLKKDRGNKNG